VAAALRLPKSEQRIALSLIPEYRSRGKGRGAANRNYGNQAGKYEPHQGKAECERRMRNA